MRYRNLGITLTRKCSASCDICCFSSSPSCCESLDEEIVKKFIATSEHVLGIEFIAFTGGEPFLDYDLLLRLVKFSTSIGKKSTVITNCFWANTQEIANERLRELKQYGVVRVSLSYDKWHSQFVSSDNVKRVVKACNEHMLPVRIGLVCLKDDKVGELIDNLGDEGLNVVFQTVPCLPVGAARDNLEESQFLKNTPNPPLPCIYDGNLVVSYDGKIYPCCSQMVVDTALCVGDYRTDTVEEVLKRIKNNGILYLLRNRGVDFFLDEAKKLGIEVPDKVVNQCELCALFFKEENLKLFLPFVKKELKEYA